MSWKRRSAGRPPTLWGVLIFWAAFVSGADDAPFLLGVLHAGQPGQETLASVDHDQAHAEVLLEGHPEQLRFPLAHEAVIDVDAREPVPHRPMHERRRDRR